MHVAAVGRQPHHPPCRHFFLQRRPLRPMGRLQLPIRHHLPHRHRRQLQNRSVRKECVKILKRICPGADSGFHPGGGQFSKVQRHCIQERHTIRFVLGVEPLMSDNFQKKIVFFFLLKKSKR